MMVLCSVVGTVLLTLIPCNILFQVRNKYGISSDLWMVPGIMRRDHVVPMMPSLLEK